MMKLYRKVKDKIITDGFLLSCFWGFYSLRDKIYALLITSKMDMHIKPSSKIIGKKYIHIGRAFFSGKHLWLEAVKMHGNNSYSPQIIIKDDVVVNDFVHIAATNYVEIGNHVLIASRVYVSDHNHGYYIGENQSSPLEPPNGRVVSRNQKVIIHDNVWIGEGACILPGVEIGEGCVIAANAVVTKDIPAFSIAAGVPAYVIKSYDFKDGKWKFH